MTYTTKERDCRFFGNKAIYHETTYTKDGLRSCYMQERKQGKTATEALRRARFLAKQYAIVERYKDYWD